MIRYAQPLLDDDDREAVAAVLRSPQLTQGEQVPRFEASVAAYCGAPHAVAVNSATSALQLACIALGLSPGQRFWTTPITFVATANAARHCGAQVEFVDIDPRTRNLCVARLAAKLEAAAKVDALPAIVAPVHFAGLACDMPAIAGLARQYGFRVLEDAAHALGARDLGGRTRIGAAQYSDCCVFSFHAVKIATSGEGGVITTRDGRLADAVRRLRSHGIVRGQPMPPQIEDAPWTYAQTELGFNFRLTDLQAALGASQMGRLDAFLSRRRELAARYDRLLSDLPLKRPPLEADASCAWHLYVVELAPALRRRVYERLRADGIEANVHYLPVYRHPFHHGEPACENAEAYYAGALSLPMHAALGDDEQLHVVERLRAALSAP